MNFKSVLCSTVMLGMSIAAMAVEPSGTLPVLHITADAPITDTKEFYVTGSYYLDPMGTEGVEALGSVEAPLPLEIRRRGNYTWTRFDKKPYKLKLDKKAALLGMNKSKHWGLLAHADDNQGFMRNITGFQLSRQIGLAWTPAEQPCEVVLNGEYIGLYFLTETVRVDDTRVNVYDYDSEIEDWMKLNPGATADQFPGRNDLTGGWLVEIDNYDERDKGEQIHVDTKQQHSQQGWNHKIMVTFDSPSDYITDAHKQWLDNEFSAIDNMIYDNDKNNCQWAEKVDLTDLAKFFIVNQLVGNYESFHGSCKLWHEKGENEKWHFGPVWDFGSSFQDGHDMSRPIWESEYVQHWIEEMYKFPAFQQEVKRVYDEFMATNPIESLKEYQAQYAARIERAAQADKQRWPQYGNDNISGKLQNVQNKLQAAIDAMPEIITGVADPTEKDIYLRGDLNGWNTDNKLKKNADGIYELHLANLEKSFKIADASWGEINYGGATNIELNVATKLTNGSGINCTLKDGSANDVTILFDLQNETLTIKGESGGNNDNNDDNMGLTRRVYFKNDNLARAATWSTPHVYTWSPEAHGKFPGTAMTETSINGQQYWVSEWTVDSADQHKPGTTFLVFSDGSSTDGSDHKTSDQVYYHNQVYTATGASNEQLSGIAAVETDEAAPEYYSIQGTRVAADNLTPGLYIVRRGNKVSKIIVK